MESTSKDLKDEPSEKAICYFLVSRVPFPPVGGDKLKYFNMVKILRFRYRVFVIVVTDEKLTREMKDFLDQNVDGYKIFNFPSLRFKYNALKTLFSSTPLQVGYYYFPEVLEFCKATIKQDDFIMASLIRTALYAETFSNTKYIDVVDSIYLNYIRSKNRVHSIFWRMIYTIEIKRLHEFEKKCVRTFDGALFTNLSERNFYQEDGNAVWIPNGVNKDLINRKFYKKKKSLFPVVVFFGKMDYQPNIDAVIWLVSKVLPLIPELKIKVIGGSPHSQIKALQSKYPGSVKIEGFLEDPYQEMYDATAVVAPMQTGGGIQNKILEAMAIGSVVLTTTLGAKAIIGSVDKEHFLICDEPEDYVVAIREIFKDEQRFAQIGVNAREIIRNTFTWEMYAETLYKSIDEVTAAADKKGNKILTA